MKAADPESIGAVEMSVFHQLSGGKSGSGPGSAVPCVLAPIATATRARANAAEHPTRRRIPCTDTRGFEQWARQAQRLRRSAQKLEISTLLLRATCKVVDSGSRFVGRCRCTKCLRRCLVPPFEG